MFDSHRTTRPNFLETAAAAFAALLVTFSLVGIGASVAGAGDVVYASRAFIPASAGALGRVTVTLSDPEILPTPGVNLPSSIGHGQTSEPTIVRDGPAACPDPSLSGPHAAVTGHAGAGGGPVAPCDRDR